MIALEKKKLDLALYKVIKEEEASVATFSSKKIQKNYTELQKNLPRIKLFFALKPLPYKEVIQSLNRVNGCFDIASFGELQILKEQNIAPERIFYSNPIKFQFDIEQIYNYGVRTFVIDNIEELSKFENYKNDCDFMLRVAFPNEEAEINLSEKFGIHFSHAFNFINTMTFNGFRCRGISFHVGSRMQSPTEFVKSIHQCKTLFIKTKEMLGIQLKTLNVGGGFPDFDAETNWKMEAFCKPINQALDEGFPHTEIFAEPGRSISNSCIDLYTKVIGKAKRNGQYWYYLNDGVYSSFSGCVFDHRVPTFEILEPKDSQVISKSVFAGPTCDSIDVMLKEVDFPELEIGDLLISRNMGAYTLASATYFNRIKKPKFVQID